MDSGHLAKIPLFAGLTLDQRDLVAGACSELEVEEGATLLEEGDFGYAMFAITAGTADVLRDGVVIRTLGSGDVFGEIAVLSGGRRTATVVARTSMCLVTVLNRDVWRLEREAPAVGAALRARIAEHLEPAVPRNP
ncbi:MAG: cyclic nucleotide-binding domain-containing protein [Actinobacteria bacterium]|nr:cyclic nucleotide-binding domain-containing protein [Actinomycetota bacterium]